MELLMRNSRYGKLMALARVLDVRVFVRIGLLIACSQFVSAEQMTAVSGMLLLIQQASVRGGGASSSPPQDHVRLPPEGPHQTQSNGMQGSGS